MRVVKSSSFYYSLTFNIPNLDNNKRKNGNCKRFSKDSRQRKRNL